MKVIEEDAKQGGAERAALPHANSGRPAGTCSASDFHAHGAPIIQGLNGCQHAAMHPKALQRCPQQIVLHAVISLLEINKRRK